MGFLAPSMPTPPPPPPPPANPPTLAGSQSQQSGGEAARAAAAAAGGLGFDQTLLTSPQGAAAPALAAQAATGAKTTLGQ